MNESQNNTEARFESLRKILLHYMPEPGRYPTPIDGLTFYRKDDSHKPQNCFNKPILALTVQGSKRTIVGNEEYRYGAGHALLAGIDMPNMSYLTQATPEKPYLVMSLEIDSHLTSTLAAQLPESKPKPNRAIKGAVVMETDSELLNSFQRLAELLDKPEMVSMLAPVILQEIYLHLLLGPHGDMLRAMNTQGTHNHHVFQSINWLRENFQQPLSVNVLADIACMAPSTYRKHFKSITTMSPTEYHKHLRLYEAQRLMLEDERDATDAGYSVGYESLTQFNREYKRLFGAPPMQNVANLR